MRKDIRKKGGKEGSQGRQEVNKPRKEAKEGRKEEWVRSSEGTE